jgi:hypothetical protein
LTTLRRGLQTAGTILANWALVAVVTMLVTWTVPRTFVGLLLALTVVPAVCLVMLGIVEAVLGRGPVARFNEFIEQRTREDRISGVRIFVHLLEFLILVGLGTALWLGIAHVAGIDTAALDAFLRRHFWP